MYTIRHWMWTINLTGLLLASGCAQNTNIARDEPSITPPATQPADAAVAQSATDQPANAAKKHSGVLKNNKPKTLAKRNQSAATTPRLSAKPTATHYPSITLNNPFTLKYGQMRRLPNSELNFKISKVSDNRCPLEMQCDQQGTVVVTLTVYNNDQRIDVLHVSANDSVPITRDRQLAYHVQLLELHPYPTVQFIELKHYVAELVVTKSRGR
ncbi:MAG: hypothetical protein LJE85_02680 [Gammaproteobacteria bacterium]|nr:hypothetical protein [Gammaproteobacteria bacterium]